MLVWQENGCSVTKQTQLPGMREKSQLLNVAKIVGEGELVFPYLCLF